MFNLAMPLAKTAQRIKNAVSRSHNMPDDISIQMRSISLWISSKPEMRTRQLGVD